MSTPAMLRNRYLAPVWCVLAAGLALLASAQDWVRAVVADPGLPRVTVVADGRTLAPVVAALALVGLAAAVVLLGGSRWARRLAAVVLLAAGAGIVVASWSAAADLSAAVLPEVAETVGHTEAPLVEVSGSFWPWASVAAGVLLVAAGLLGLFAEPTRRPALTPRYDAEVPGRRSSPGLPQDIDLGDSDALWKALDRGEDPTAEDDR